MNTLKTIYDKLGDKTELAKHNVELGYLQDIQKKAESQLKKYSDIPELVKYWQFVSGFITSNEGKISNFIGTRSAYLMGINDMIPELENNLNEIEGKFKSIGINALDNPEYKKSFTALVQLKNLLIDLKRTTDLPQFK